MREGRSMRLFGGKRKKGSNRAARSDMARWRRRWRRAVRPVRTIAVLSGIVEEEKCNKNLCSKRRRANPSFEKLQTIGGRRPKRQAQKDCAGVVLRRPSPSTVKPAMELRDACAAESRSAVACFSDAKRRSNRPCAATGATMSDDEAPANVRSTDGLGEDGR